jgi:hypothetical protein
MLMVLRGMDDQGGFINWTSYLVLLAISVWLKYCIGFCLNSTTFWFIEVYGFYGIFDQVFDLAQYQLLCFVELHDLLSNSVPVSLMATFRPGPNHGPTALQFWPSDFTSYRFRVGSFSGESDSTLLQRVIVEDTPRWYPTGRH